MALTPEQIAEFKALGYVLVPNLINPSILDNWHAQIRAQFGDLSDPAQQNAAGPPQQHREDITILRGFRFSPKETQLVNQPKVKAIVDHMSDGQFCGEDGNLRLLWPEPKSEWRLPERGHIDGYLGRRRTMPFSARIGDLYLRRRTARRWHRLLAAQPYQIMGISSQTSRSPQLQL